MRIKVSTAAILAACGSAPAQDGRFTTSGYGCPMSACSSHAVFEILPAGGWDLDGRSITYAPVGASWRAQFGGGYVAPSALATVIAPGDDVLRGPFALPFVFTHAGGRSTNAIDVASNGYVYLEPSTIASTRCCNGRDALASFLADTPSVAVLGTDLAPHQGGVWSFDVQTVQGAQVALVTWAAVPEYSAGGANTVQCQLWQNGEIVVSHLATNGASGSHSALVGVSPGGGQPDCGSIDHTTDLPFLGGTPIGFDVPALGALGTLRIGDTFTIVVSGLAPSATAAALLFASGTAAAPFPLSLIGAPAGCDLQVDPIYHSEPMSLALPIASLGVPTAPVPSAIGLAVHTQAFVADLGRIGIHAIPVFASNVGTLTFGGQPTLTFVCEGQSAFAGGPTTNGFFRLVSRASATHPHIVHLRCDLAAVGQYFDTDGNLGTAPSGLFDDGNGAAGGCRNAYYGSDLATGLRYGAPQPASGCDAAAFTGFVPSNPGPFAADWDTLDFDFAPGQFGPGEGFAFDCDLDGGAEAGGDIAMTVTVTFADATIQTGTTTQRSAERSEVDLRF